MDWVPDYKLVFGPYEGAIERLDLEYDEVEHATYLVVITTVGVARERLMG